MLSARALSTTSTSQSVSLSHPRVASLGAPTRSIFLTALSTTNSHSVRSQWQPQRRALTMKSQTSTCIKRVNLLRTRTKTRIQIQHRSPCLLHHGKLDQKASYLLGRQSSTASLTCKLCVPHCHPLRKEPKLQALILTLNTLSLKGRLKVTTCFNLHRVAEKEHIPHPNTSTATVIFTAPLALSRVVSQAVESGSI